MKLFKPFSSLKKYQAAKISVSSDNLSWCYGTSSEVHRETTQPTDMVTYNTICVIDTDKSYTMDTMYKNNTPIATTTSGRAIETNTNGYVRGAYMFTSQNNPNAYTGTISYVGPKLVSVQGSNGTTIGRVNMTPTGFVCNTYSTDHSATDNNTYAVTLLSSTPNYSYLSMQRWYNDGNGEFAASRKMIVGHKQIANNEFVTGLDNSAYNGTYVFGSNFKYYQVGSGDQEYNKICPLSDDNQVPSSYLETFKNTINYFPYDGNVQNKWYNLNNKVLTMNNGSETRTNLQFGFDGTPYLTIHNLDVQVVKLDLDGIHITYNGSKYKMDYSKAVELGLFVAE